MADEAKRSSDPNALDTSTLGASQTSSGMTLDRSCEDLRRALATAPGAEDGGGPDAADGVDDLIAQLDELADASKRSAAPEPAASDDDVEWSFDLAQ